MLFTSISIYRLLTNFMEIDAAARSLVTAYSGFYATDKAAERLIVLVYPFVAVRLSSTTLGLVQSDNA